MMPTYPLALPRVEGPVFALDGAMLERGLKASRESPRRRIMLPMHRSAGEHVQRLLNFMQPGSYARPHLHPKAENIEHVVTIKGVAGFVVFDDQGNVTGAHRLEAGNPASCLIDIEQGVWHTLVPLSDDMVALEIKRGPYDAATDKRFAPWAPEENSPEAANYLRRLEAVFDGRP
ncbi:MAG: WbuC family cupin fold metalloprotein [Chthoniobacteraceae bacterium]